jgi:hypothetical protein
MILKHQTPNSRLRLRLWRGKPDLRPRRSEAKTGKTQRSSNF